ncbi:MAG: chromosome segregation protein SMC [Desulfobacteraceae bacterium]|nr:MAG: chromosome segregation protein SMC [Desulfobacteraceae bacterium]
MKIKKLYMRGFKSFMDRLEIAFPFGISGIVGPNGCGKSNIVDAIRWCMGEQSPKQLRGRRMEDVIFSGAGDYKALGMAEVSILLENGDGTFPPAFAQDPELSVTRRLYRSGESEYLINKVPCRLKDIQEIFMDTGLGNKAYSIIGQGQIGTIIEQKPEETRVMLEEAAGVTKYRKKVEASQRKIELTEGNLQRVEDILGEVQRQIRSLKRQASKARRYKNICEKIQNLELTLYANTFHQYKEESGNKLRSTDDLVQQEVAESTKFAQLQAEIETMNLELEEKDAALSGLRKNHLHLKEGVHRKETGLESLKGEIKVQEELEGRLKGEREEIRKRLVGLKEEKASLERNMEKMKERSRELEGEITLREKRLSARRDLLKGINDDHEKARAELSAGANKELGLNHESGYLNKILSQITDSRSRLEKELKEMSDRIENIIKASERKSLAREATSERLREIEASIQDQNMNCEELGQIKNRVEMELKSAESDLNVCQSRLASLQALTDNFEGYKMGVRTIMKAGDLAPHQHGRVKGLVADVIQVDPGYEQAVEAVLADKLQYIIVESQEDGRQAIEYLKKKARGRSSFVPLKDLNEKSGNKDRHSQFPPLTDFISVPETYRPLLYTLLEDTVLAKDLETALLAWKNNEGNLCFVTIDGDIVDRRGVISGGKLAQSSRGLLARKREITALKEKSTLYLRKVNDLKLKLEDIKGEIQEKKEALETLTEQRWTCQEEINESDKALFRLGQELDQLEKLSQRISSDLEGKGIEQKNHKMELSRIEAALHQRKIKRQEEEEYFRKKEIELKESQEEFDQFRDELASIKTDYRIFKEEQRSLLREIELKDDYADDSSKRLQKIEEDISLGVRSRDECQRRKEILSEELGDLYENLRQAEEALTRADRERQAFQDGIKEEERKAEQLREEIEALKEKINRSKLEHSEISFKMNNLVEMVKEKSNMNLNDIYEQYLDEDFSGKEVEERLEHQKQLRQRLGEVNLTAIKEHEALKERYEFIKNQREDLISSIDSLRIAITKINRTSLEKFRNTFQEVDKKLKQIFPILFNGGTAGLRLTDETRPLESGVLVEVQPPGKKLSHMGLLSGGEKALVAMAFLFAIYMIKPSPFCLLDEVDSPLDEANIDRFNKLLEEIKRASQIIMVTHSRRTMEIVDRLYGITMEKAGISKTVSVDIQGMKKQSINDELSG